MAAHRGIQLLDQRAKRVIGNLADMVQPVLQLGLAEVVGQPGAVIPTLGITKELRVVEFRGIEPQEYDSLRIVFRLDQSGNIYNIDCG